MSSSGTIILKNKLIIDQGQKIILSQVPMTEAGLFALQLLSHTIVLNKGEKFEPKNFEDYFEALEGVPTETVMNYEYPNVMTVGYAYNCKNNNHQSYQEVVEAQNNITLVKAFIDFDLSWSYTTTITEDMFHEFESSVLKEVVHLLSNALPLGCSIVAIDSSSCYKYCNNKGVNFSKISFHLVSNYICFMKEAKEFAQQMKEAWFEHIQKINVVDITPNKTLASEPIDTAPYKNGHQSFRMRGAFPWGLCSVKSIQPTSRRH